MRIEETGLPGVLRVETRVHADARGWVRESWRAREYAEVGIAGPFVQDNVSFSRRGVLRGLHFQHPRPQGKLVSAVHGEVWDVAVDVRIGSAFFGRWTAASLSAENGVQLWIPPGFAHGFAVLSAEAVVSYRCTDTHHPPGERLLRWDDPALAIPWPLRDPVLSPRDAAAPRLDALGDALPPFAAG